MKQRIQEELQNLWHLETNNQTDNFEQIVRLVNQYKEHFGTEPFIVEFIGEYLTDRHERLYSENRKSK